MNTTKELAEEIRELLESKQYIVDGEKHRRIIRSQVEEQKELFSQLALGTETIVNLREELEQAKKQIEWLKQIDSEREGDFRLHANSLKSKCAELEQVKKERDKALAYPTVDAYEAACGALDKHRVNAESLRSELTAIRTDLEFYGREENYDQPLKPKAGGGMMLTASDVQKDGGEHARAIIARISTINETKEAP